MHSSQWLESVLALVVFSRSTFRLDPTDEALRQLAPGSKGADENAAALLVQGLTGGKASVRIPSIHETGYS